MLLGLQGFVAAIGIGALTGVLLTLYFLGPTYVAQGGKIDVEAMIAPIVFVYGLGASAVAGLIAMVLPRTSVRGGDNFFVLLVLTVLIQAAITLAMFPGAFGLILLAMMIPANMFICSPWFRARYE